MADQNRRSLPLIDAIEGFLAPDQWRDYRAAFGGAGEEAAWQRLVTAFRASAADYDLSGLPFDGHVRIQIDRGFLRIPELRLVLDHETGFARLADSRFPNRGFDDVQLLLTPRIGGDQTVVERKDQDKEPASEPLSDLVARLDRFIAGLPPNASRSRAAAEAMREFADQGRDLISCSLDEAFAQVSHHLKGKQDLKGKRDVSRKTIERIRKVCG